jgi:Kdo-III transferase WaaZ
MPAQFNLRLLCGVFAREFAKIGRELRKLSLGKRYRHRTRFPRQFSLRRGEHFHEILWANRSIGYVKNFAELTGRFKGACFIVGSGPSVRNFDIRRIASFDTITLNGAILKFIASGLAPRHHLMADRWSFIKSFEFARSGLQSGATCFFPDSGIGQICAEEPALLRYSNLYCIDGIDKRYDRPRLEPHEFYEKYRSDREIYLSEDYRDRRGAIGFSSSPEHGFFSSKTVAIWAVQLAYVLGYRRMFFLGMELGATGNTHFHDAEGAQTNELNKFYEPDIRVCFQLAKQASKVLGFEMYNLTPDSLLTADIVPKMTFDHALNLLDADKGPGIWPEQCGLSGTACLDEDRRPERPPPTT